MSTGDRGVDIEQLVSEVQNLRAAALQYVRATDNSADVGLDPEAAAIDLETAAIRFVRKLDHEVQKANQVDYLAIVARAERDREESDN